MDAANLAIALALGAAASAGTADYLAAHAARRLAAIRVAAWVQSLGLVIVLASLAFSGPPALALRDVAISILAGLSIAIGITALYRALAIGPIGVTAPTAAVVGAALPVGVSIALGDTLTGGQNLGLLLGLIGVALFASGPIGRVAGDRWTGLAFALLAGAGIGGVTLGLDAVDPATGFWPLAIVRVVAAASLWLVVLRADRAGAGTQINWPRLAVAGVLDGAAMISFVLALQVGHVAVIAVITALYPAFTVVLATVIDHERLRRPQLAGLVCATVAIVLISGAA